MAPILRSHESDESHESWPHGPMARVMTSDQPEAECVQPARSRSVFLSSRRLCSTFLESSCSCCSCCVADLLHILSRFRFRTSGNDLSGSVGSSNCFCRCFSSDYSAAYFSCNMPKHIETLGVKHRKNPGVFNVNDAEASTQNWLAPDEELRAQRLWKLQGHYGWLASTTPHRR